MDEMTNAQNVDTEVDNQEEAFEMPEADMPAFDEEDELFDMDMANQTAVTMLEQQQQNEMNQFKEIEGFASIFPDNWVITPPTDPEKVTPIIAKQLAKKTRR